MIVLGIDPGEAWCGFAALQMERRFLRVQASTFSTDNRNVFRMVQTLLPFPKYENVTVVCEDFQVRPVGHQRFTRGQTLRLIGALEYHVINQGWLWRLIPPGKWQRELPQIFGNNFLSSYREHWPDKTNPQWDHCLSAWRVIGRYLLAEQLLSVLKPIRSRAHALRNDDAFWADSAPWVHAHARRDDLTAPPKRHSLEE